MNRRLFPTRLQLVAAGSEGSWGNYLQFRAPGGNQFNVACSLQDIREVWPLVMHDDVEVALTVQVKDPVTERTELAAWQITVEHIEDGVTGTAEFTQVEMEALRTHMFGRGNDDNPWGRALKRLRKVLS